MFTFDRSAWMIDHQHDPPQSSDREQIAWRSGTLGTCRPDRSATIRPTDQALAGRLTRECEGGGDV
jgi:hypothetical protein